MKELIEMSESKIKWCNSFLNKCIIFMLKTESADTDGFPSLKQLNNLLTNDAGFSNIDIELLYMLRKLDYLKKNCTIKGFYSNIL